MNRVEQLAKLAARTTPWDMVIVGGGATGVGVAVDAASRGYEVLLVEQSDFGKGTSSRSTKLVHGGVRYLEQGNVSLVMEALQERGLLRQNAPHLVHDLPFIVPNYDWWEAPFYGMGLKVYDLLAGKYGFGASRILNRQEILERIPTIKTEGLKGGVIYYDGQFDDSRLLINMVATAIEQGATAVNYMSVTDITKDSDGFVSGVHLRDHETNKDFEVSARVVINATGAFTDRLRRLADPDVTPMIAPSQGIHLVFDRALMPGDSAIMVPHTSDGRVMFAIPWHNHLLVGTTDTPIQEPSLEPKPFDHEIEFILETAGRYLSRKPERKDVLSVFVGIRPLVKAGGAGTTSQLSRDHTIHIDNSGLLTICGGKWTTYRKMAEDCVDSAITLGKLDEMPCVSKKLKIHGWCEDPEKYGVMAFYGSDAAQIQALIDADSSLAKPLHSSLPYTAAEVVWATRFEMARTVEDVLSRRLRALFLNSHAAIQSAPAVAEIMARELGYDNAWVKAQILDFSVLAQSYCVNLETV
ncbi:MAG: glycerol-3-phosphate dehydrogenase/oxidase [Cyanobacteria bacterium SZAS LIN-3]|nr:glycerol-3-phosphate dehydrogenase/oxidase [Cyanobacteria bacterium SZAS LIN-3]